MEIPPSPIHKVAKAEEGTHLLTIPAELLIKVLLHLPMAQDLIAMFVVCKRIHHIMKNCHELWSNIPLDGGPIVTDAFIHRCGPNLTLSLRSDDPEPPASLYQTVKANMNRASCIHLSIQPPHAQELMRNLATCRSSVLSTLRLTYYNWTDLDTDYVPLITDGLLGGQSSSLTILHLLDVTVHDLPQVPHLQDLQLFNTHTPLEHIPSILSAVPNLQYLTLINPIHESDAVVSPITAPLSNASDNSALLQLQRVIIRDMELNPLARLLSLLPDPCDYLEIMQRSYTRRAEQWSLSNTATASIVGRLSRFRHRLSLDGPEIVSIEVEMRPKPPPGDDTDGNSSKDEDEQDENDSEEEGEVDGASSEEHEEGINHVLTQPYVPESYTTISMGSQAAEQSSSKGVFWMSGTCMSPVNDAWLLTRARAVAITMDNCGENMVLDIQQHIAPALANSIEILIFRRTWLKGDYGHCWMDAGLLKTFLEFLTKRSDGGNPVKSLRFENCDPTLQGFSDRVVECRLVKDVVWE